MKPISIFEKNLLNLNQESENWSGIAPIKIPYFQRKYRWDEKNWNVSIESFKKIYNGENYFMGSLILEGSNLGFLEIIDGQQRITTLAIFLQVLADKFGKEQSIENLFIKKIQHNCVDKNVFNKIIKKEYKSDQEYNKKYKKGYKISQVEKCYDYFGLKIDEQKDDVFTKENVDKFFNNFSQIIFAVILLNGHNQQQIFDTLNTNSVSLTQAELIKNHLFKDNEELWREKWQKVFEEGGESKYWQTKVGSKENIDRFLLSLYYSNRSGNNQPIKDDELLLCYKNGNREEWIDKINKNHNNFRENINCEILNEEIKIDKLTNFKTLMLFIFAFEFYVAIPYLFYLCDKPEKEEVAKYLEKFLIRRWICDYEIRSYNKLFSELIANKVDTLVEIQNKLTIERDPDRKNPKTIPNDKNFENIFLEKEFSNKMARFVLYRIEISLRSKDDRASLSDKTIQPWNLLNTKNKLSLEHINPISDEKDFTYTIGNMTLLTGSKNSAFSNKKWIDKRKLFKDKTKNILIMEDYIDENLDDESIIKDRTKWLFGKAKELWA